MSIAALARVARWKVDGSFTSAQYLTGAKSAFDYLNTNGVKYDDDGKENVIDDYTGLLAASELYATTQDATYLQAARARATSLVGRLGADGYFIADGASRPFWHASDAGLPIVALARYVQVETDNGKAPARQTGHSEAPRLLARRHRRRRQSLRLRQTTHRRGDGQLLHSARQRIRLLVAG